MNTNTTYNGPEDEKESAETNTIGEIMANESEAKLIKLEDAAEVEPNGGKDINHKITALDGSLAQLREELGAINNSVEEGLDRLSDNDTDLRAKVSETYKRLGEIDNAYKALIEISHRIDGDIRRLNGDVSVVAEQSASGIKNLEISNLEKSNELALKNEQVASRVNELVQNSRVTKELFDEKIKATSGNIQLIEKTLVEKINTLAELSDEKDQAIEDKVEKNHAKIIKLQSVDEAIIRRATTLEISSAELSAQAGKIENSVEQLDASSQILSARVDDLRDRHEELAKVVASNSDMIGVLRNKADSLADSISTLAGIQRRDFNRATFGILLVLALVGVVYVVHQGQFAETGDLIAAEADKVEGQIAGLQQAQQASTVATGESLERLQSQVATLDAEREALQQELKAVKGELSQVGDEVDSVSARFDNSTSFYRLGDDNVMHGEYWISQQAADNFSIQLAASKDRNALFELAMRYNHRLTDKLSMVEVRDQMGTRYVLLSGNYKTRQSAQTALNDLGWTFQEHRPAIIQMRDVQAFIAAKGAESRS